MTQVLFASATTPQETDLDANFTALYNLREIISTSGYTAATPKITIDANGTFGIGIVPSAWSNSFNQRAIQISTVGVLASLSASAGNQQVHLANNAWGFSAAATYLTSDFATDYLQFAGQHQWRIAPSGTAGNAVTFTQAMTLDANNNWILAAANASTAQQSGAYVAPSFSATNAAGMWLGHATGTATGAVYHSFGYNATVIGSITQSGTTAVLYNTTSDERLKANIIDAAPAGDLLDTVKVRQFHWKSDGSHQSYGFIAQELVQVVPSAVYAPADPDEMMAVDYSKLVPLLVKEVQSLRARLAAANIA